MTRDEELQELRAFKACHEHTAIDRAFKRLEGLLEAVNYDPIMSPRAFRVIADCLLVLRDEVRK
jgi:hypothetical protein